MSSIPKDQWARVGELYLASLPVRAVAEKVHSSLDAVTYVLRKLDIPRRSFWTRGRITLPQNSSFTIRKSASAMTKELNAIGAMLYWAEGHKTSSAPGIDFANSDPRMLVLFMKFLRSRYHLDEKRLRVYIYCYANQPIDGLKNIGASFWVSLDHNLPSRTFVKIQQ